MQRSALTRGVLLAAGLLLLLGAESARAQTCGEHVGPAFLHHLRLSGFDTQATGCGLVVIEFHEGCINDEIPSPAHLQAEIDIVESYRQLLLVETTNLVENISPCHQACARHRAVIPRNLKLAANSWRFRRKSAKCMRRNPADADNHAGVLDRVVRKEKSWTDCPHLGPLHVFRHDSQPIGVDDLDVAVQKQEPRAVGLFDRQIVDR